MNMEDSEGCRGSDSVREEKREGGDAKGHNGQVLQFRVKNDAPAEGRRTYS